METKRCIFTHHGQVYLERWWFLRNDKFTGVVSLCQFGFHNGASNSPIIIVKMLDRRSEIQFCPFVKMWELQYITSNIACNMWTLSFRKITKMSAFIINTSQSCLIRLAEIVLRYAKDQHMCFAEQQ